MFKYFGLETYRAETDEYLNTQYSFFRFCCLPQGLTPYSVACGLCSVAIGIGLLATVAQTKTACDDQARKLALHQLNHTTPGQLDCTVPVWFEGTFLVSVMTELFFFLSLLNACIYRRTEYKQHTPFLVHVQQYLHVICLPLSFVACAVYDTFLRPMYGIDNGYFAINVMSALAMAIWGVFDLYEPHWGHILVSQLAMVSYVLFLTTLLSAGVDVYKMFNPDIHTGNVIGLFIFAAVIHFIFIAWNKFKIFRWFGTFWKKVEHPPPSTTTDKTDIGVDDLT